MPKIEKKGLLISIPLLGGLFFLFSIFIPVTFAGHANLNSTKKFRSPYSCAKFLGNKNTGTKCNGGEGFWTGVGAVICTDPSLDEAAQVAAGKAFDCHTATWVDSSAPPPTCTFNTTDGGDYDLTKPESGASCSYGSDGATGSITYTYKTLKDGKTCTKLTSKPTKTESCCRGTPYTCTFDRCPASKPSTPQKATCTQSNSYLGSASCPGTTDKYVNGVKVTTFPPERACDDCANSQYSSCSQTSCSGVKKVNTCSTRPAECSGPESKDITTNDNCGTCADSQYTGCAAEQCSGSSKIKRCTSWPSTCIGSLDSGQNYHTVALGTCYTYYSSCSWDTSKCSATSGVGAGQKTRSCTEERKTNLTADAFQDASFITSPLNCGDCSLTTDYTCTFATNCPLTAPELTNRRSITAAMEAATCTLNNASNPTCKPLTNPSQSRTCTTCAKDVWTSGSLSTCDDSTSKQTLEQTESFNCEVDSNDESGTSYTVGGVTGTVKTGSKTEVGSNTPKLYKRTLEVDCTPAPGGNLPTGDTKGQTLRYNGSKWEKSIALFNYDGPKIGIGIGYSLAATPTEVLQVSANADSSLTSRILVVDNDPGNNPEIQLQYSAATVGAPPVVKNWHWSLFVDKSNDAAGTPRNSFNIWGAGYDGATGSNRLTILPNGKVGIGVSDPDLPLQIDHATAPFLGFRTTGDTANSVRFSVGARDDTNARRAEIEVQSKHDLAFFTSSILRAAISSDGAFTIGTSTQFADSAALLVHKAAIPGTGFITGEAVLLAPAPAAPAAPAARTPDAPPAPAPPASSRTPTPAPASAPAPAPASAPASAPAPAPAPAPTPSPQRPAIPDRGGGRLQGRAGEKTLLSSLTGFFANLWNTITGSPIQSGYASVVPAPPVPTGNTLAQNIQAHSLVEKKLTGSGTKFNTEGLKTGDIIFIQMINGASVQQRFYQVKNDPSSDTEVSVYQISGPAGGSATAFESLPDATTGSSLYPFSIIKKGHVFRTERDIGAKDADNKPFIAHDLIVDNRGIVNIGGGIAPPEMSDMALFVTGKVKADEYCIGMPGTCVTSWSDLGLWSKTTDGKAIYPTNSTELAISEDTTYKWATLSFGIGSGEMIRSYRDNTGTDFWKYGLNFLTNNEDRMMIKNDGGIFMNKAVTIGKHLKSTDFVPLEIYHPSFAHMWMHATRARANGEADTDPLNDVGMFVGARNEGDNRFGQIGTKSNHDLSIYTSDTKRMTITKDGWVGIGTTSPRGPFEVKQHFFVEATQNSNIDFSSNYDEATKTSVVYGFVIDSSIGKRMHQGDEIIFSLKDGQKVQVRIYDIVRNRPKPGILMSSLVKFADWIEFTPRIRIGSFYELLDSNNYIKFEVLKQSPAIFVRDNNNVGIGTNSPEAKLSIAADRDFVASGMAAYSALDITTVGGGSRRTAWRFLTGGAHMGLGADGNTGAGKLTITPVDFTDPNDLKIDLKKSITLKNMGGPNKDRIWVGINTSDPKYELDVVGDINVGARADETAAAKGRDTLAYAPERVGFDVAELFESEEEAEVGDVMVVGASERKLKKSQRPYEDAVVGVVSGSPAVLFEGEQLKISPKKDRFVKGVKPPIALSGRVPVKVSAENGPVRVGDYLTTSSKPGVAMRATEAGPVIGIALEQHTGKGDGKVLMFINIKEKQKGQLFETLQRRIERLENKVRK